MRAVAAEIVSTPHLRRMLATGCGLQVLLLDKVSMMDDQVWECMTKILGLADHARHRGFRPGHDEYGSIHMAPRGADCDFDRICPMFVFAACDGALRGLQLAVSFGAPVFP